ncbi:uncharacterized protein METZ01_LOCUS164097, partial [marine metagenome]
MLYHPTKMNLLKKKRLNLIQSKYWKKICRKQKMNWQNKKTV